jgi:tetratricopeptide (TPR) repeat protein
MKSKKAGAILFLVTISLIICNEQVFAANPQLRPKKPVKPANVIEQINSYINLNETQNALKLLNKAALTDPYNPKLFSIAAGLFYKSSQYSEAEMLARRALSLNSQDNNCYLILGNILLNNYKSSRLYNDSLPTDQDLSLLNESMQCFNTVSENDPASALPHIGLAKVYLVKDNKSKVYDEILKAKELTGNNPDVLFEIGELFYECESYEKAIQYFKKSISANLKDSDKAHTIIADIYEKLGNLEDAQNEYAAILKYKDSPEIKDKLEVLNSKFAAVSDTNKTGDSNAKYFSDILEADSLLVMNRFSEARNLYLKILQKNPDNDEALSGLCELYYTQWLIGHYDTKKYYLDSPYFANIQPDSIKVSIVKFRLAAEPERNDTLKEALEHIANNKSDDFYDKFNAARALFLLGNYITAGIKLQELSASYLSDYEKLNMAKLFYFDQNYPEAEKLLKEIQNPEYSKLVKTLKDRISFKQAQANDILTKGLILFKEKQYKDAILKFEEELKLLPTDKKAHLYYAYSLQKTGNAEKAIDEINIYSNLELLYPSKKPELNMKDTQKIIKTWQK